MSKGMYFLSTFPCFQETSLELSICSIWKLQLQKSTFNLLPLHWNLDCQWEKLHSKFQCSCNKTKRSKLRLNKISAQEVYWKSGFDSIKGLLPSKHTWTPSPTVKINIRSSIYQCDLKVDSQEYTLTPFW